jgi:hypothetical protein
VLSSSPTFRRKVLHPFSDRTVGRLTTSVLLATCLASSSALKVDVVGFNRKVSERLPEETASHRAVTAREKTVLEDEGRATVAEEGCTRSHVTLACERSRLRTETTFEEKQAT